MTTISRKATRWTPLGIFAMILGFAVWWPLGLAIIGYILWGGSIDKLAEDGVAHIKKMLQPTVKQDSSGNSAFDSYREATLKRLEQEQAEFDEYVQKLRDARDKEEFDRFMHERDVETGK